MLNAPQENLLLSHYIKFVYLLCMLKHCYMFNSE